MLRKGQVLFTYLHLAADAEQAEGLMRSKATAIAYETVTGRNGSLPLLTPMSEVAGRMSIQVGAASLQKANGGFGVLLGGVPGVAPAKVVILGGGVSGTHAAEMAVGLRADVTVVDRSVSRLRELSAIFGSSAAHDLLNHRDHRAPGARCGPRGRGPCWWPGGGAEADHARHGEDHEARRGAGGHLRLDQGGCFETSRPTTHADPTFVVDGVIHYCVANMPGAVPRTSTFALTNATLPYVHALADLGWQAALKRDPGLAAGLNVHAGQITHEVVARALGCSARPTRPDDRSARGQVPTK